MTGERDDLPNGLASWSPRCAPMHRCRPRLDSARHAGASAAVGQIADGVIVGTRLVRVVDEAGGAAPAAEAVSGFIRAAREAIGDRGRSVG